MWPNPQKTEDLVLFTEEILNGKFQFLCNTKIRLHAKMEYFNDYFSMKKKKKKKKKRVQTHYSLKKWSFKKKSFILNMDPEEELAATVVVYILEKKKKRKKWKTRSTWVKPWPTRRDALGIALLSLHESGFKSHKHLSFLQMQIKLPVSSCFLFMVAFIPFLYQLYFFILWNRN